MLISSNPGYTSESIFPRMIVKFHDRETMAEINEKRYMEANDLAGVMSMPKNMDMCLHLYLFFEKWWTLEISISLVIIIRQSIMMLIPPKLC